MSCYIDLSRIREVINPVYYKLLWCYKRYQVYYGGAGSGKSVFVAQKVLYRIMTEQKCRVLVLRKIGKTTRYSTWASILSLISKWKLKPFFEIHKSEYRISYIGNENEIIFAGLDDPEKIKSAHEINIVWLEEATEFTPDDLKQLSLRLREKGIRAEIFLTFNPIDEDHWLKAYFFDRVDRRFKIVHTTYLDNEHLDDDYIEELNKLKEIDPVYYDIYALGKWGHIRGARVFPQNIIIHEFPYDENSLENVRYGLDFGFNHATALMSTGFKDGELYVFDEFWKKGRTNTQLISDIASSGWDKSRHIRCDVDPSRYNEFRDAGFNISQADKGSGSLKAGIDYLRGLKIHIHATKCPNAAREFPAFRYREGKDGTLYEEPVEINDDTIAGVRYAVEDLWMNNAPCGLDLTGLRL